MKNGTRIVLLLVAFACSAEAPAQDEAGNKDAAALEVLKQMDAYTESMLQFEVAVESYTDALLEELIIISNPSSSIVTVDRSGSLHAATDNGAYTTDVYFHNGVLTVFSDERNYYARTKVPGDLQDALVAALEDYDVEAPLFDFLLLNSLEHLVTDEISVMYVTDKSLVRGIDCHHIIVSGPRVDLQVWVQEGNQPVPIRTLMTYKSALGSPRHEVFMDWRAKANPDPSIFEFKAPDGATEIEFINLP
jgi:hypothetical protein